MGTVLSTKTWVWCGGTQPCEERAGDNQVTQRFFAQGFQRLAPYSSLPASFYYTKDHLGSVREVVAATGTLRARYDYDAWGNRTKLSGDLDADFGFTGHLHHKPTGLILTHYRAYDPRLARWLSRDPIAERGGINLYGYVYNDPVNWVDPNGLSKSWPWSWWDLLTWPIHLPYELGASISEPMMDAAEQMDANREAMQKRNERWANGDFDKCETVGGREGNEAIASTAEAAANAAVTVPGMITSGTPTVPTPNLSPAAAAAVNAAQTAINEARNEAINADRM